MAGLEFTEGQWPSRGREKARSASPASATDLDTSSVTNGLPSGTVTFLFTDIESSTRLLAGLGDSYGEVLDRHRELLQAAADASGGVQVDAAGDGLFFAFARAAGAIAAAVAGQRAITEEPWPYGATVQVRMGMHTAEAVPRADDYVSLGVHQAARVAAAAHGGQILASAETVGALVGSPPGQAVLVEAGLYNLKDFDRPVLLFQVQGTGLPSRFPALRARPAARHNLPAYLSSFVGRESEIREVERLLGQGRLVTVSGPGGCGKTRLALHVAQRLVDAYPNGVWFVDLAPVSDPGLVVRSIADVFSVREEPGRPLLESLRATVADRQMLLVVDNCEHLIDDCAVTIEQLLTAAPSVRVLATSRERLGVPGEHAVPLQSLALPTAADTSRTAILGCESVRLFMDRALAVRPDFSVGDHEVANLVDIVCSLDGIPLALELIGARAAVLSVTQIAARLDDRFRLVSGGPRTRLPRQQTLAGTIDWSYQLLDDAERALFRRLAVFTGGFSLEAAEAVTVGNDVRPTEVLDLLSSLVAKSLVAVTDQGDSPRYRLLETIRAYAADKRAESVENLELRHRHLEWFVHVAETSEPERRPMRLLDADHDNFRSALDHAVASDNTSAGLRLATALTPFWTSQGNWSEACARFQTLFHGDCDDPHILGPALAASGNLFMLRGDYPAAQPMFEDACARAQDAGDLVIRARGLLGRGYIEFRKSRLEDAEQLWERALETAERSGDKSLVATVLRSLAITAGTRGDQLRCRDLLERGIGLAHEVRDQQQLRLLLSAAAEMNTFMGEYGVALEQYEDALELAGDIGDHAGRATLLADLGWLEYLRSNCNQARRCAIEAVGLAVEFDNKRVLANALRLLGEITSCQGTTDEAERLLQRAIEVARDLGAPAEIGGVLCSIACLAVDTARFADAQRIVEELMLLNPLRHSLKRATWYWVLAEVAMGRGDLTAARTHYQAELDMAIQALVPYHQANALRGLGDVACAESQFEEAADLHLQALELRTTIGAQLGIVNSLEGVAAVVVAVGDAIRGAQMLGAADSARTRLRTPLTRREERHLATTLADVEHALGQAGAEAAWLTGTLLNIADAIELSRGLRTAHP